MTDIKKKKADSFIEASPQQKKLCIYCCAKVMSLLKKFGVHSLPHISTFACLKTQSSNRISVCLSVCLCVIKDLTER